MAVYIIRGNNNTCVVIAPNVINSLYIASCLITNTTTTCSLNIKGNVLQLHLILLKYILDDIHITQDVAYIFQDVAN